MTPTDQSAPQPENATAIEPAAPRRRGPKVDVELTRQRRADILREAARLFDQVGYHGVNMEMIAEAAGLKKPTLYHYIRGKDEILFQIQEQMMLTLRSRIAERREAGLGPLAVLRGVFEDIFQNLHDSPGAVRSFFEHGSELSAEQRTRVGRERRAYSREVMQVIEAGMAAGILRRGDARLTAMCMFGISNWAYQWYRPGRDPEPKAMAARCFEILASGMMAPAA
ncbi:MAG TPA: TetR/AcrR family transcriptional regulator [Paracoccaceae bacterium]|nr:TetR/AcrR family transcriptional regulator [Paracoccaceae bacterium]